jgi:hypothetical protein
LSEELSARFGLAPPQLAVPQEVIQDLLCEHQDMTGFADRVLDHAASARHSMQDGSAGHGRSSM